MTDRDEQKAREIVADHYERVGHDISSAACDELQAAIASALREARREERERCAGVADKTASVMEAARGRAAAAGREWVASHRESDAVTAMGIASDIRALEDK